MSFPPHMPMMPPMPFFPPMMMPPPNLSTPPPGMPAPTTNSTQKPGDNEKKTRFQGATTVFVGSISDRAPDVMIKRMLQLCGDVVNWKRIQGADGKLQAFGFCEYENPEGTLRCIRLLNGYQIQDKKLLVKVDAKTKTVIDEYKKKKRRELAKKAAKDLTAFKLLYEEGDEENSADADGKKKSGEEGEIEEEDDDYIDNDTRREDSAIKQAIETVMREYAREMNLKALEAKEQALREAQMAAAAPPPPQPPVDVTESPVLDDHSAPLTAQRGDPNAALENEEEKRSLISNEIQSFRHRFKDEETKMRNTEKERRDRYERERAVQREKRAAEESAKSPSSPSDDRHRSSSSRHHTSNSIRSLTNDRRTTPSSSSRYDRRSPRSYHRRSRTKSPTSRSHRNDEDDEETIERKRQERRIREKENQYRDKLKAWEQREERKRSDYQAEKKRELLRLRDEEKERKHSLTFHESYKDDTHDSIYYKGAALARRIKDREREIEFDRRDRQREKDEIEDLKKKLSSEGKYDDIELEIKQRLKKEEETVRKRLADLVKATSDISSEDSDNEQETKKKSSTSIKKETIDQTYSNAENKEQLPETKVKTEYSQNDVKNSSPPHTSALGGAPITGTKIASKRRLAVNEAFRDDQEDENTAALPKKSKLSAIPDQQLPTPQSIPVVVKEEETPVVKDSEPNSTSNSARSQEEKRQAVCKLIESIPTKKEDLFTFPLDWSLLDSTLMEKRIKPWVNKKIVEYLGEEEPALTDFICTSVMTKQNAESILNDIQMVLDNEADVFVVKMWRLIVYEIEAKRNGLSK